MRRRWTRRRVAGALACVALVIGAATGTTPTALAGPPVNTGSSDGPEPQAPVDNPRPVAASIDRVQKITDRRLKVFVRSPAMGRTVPVELLLPKDNHGPRPTLYMLDGRSASNEVNNWTKHGGAVQFFADKNVNVVLTLGGPASYYTDWQHPDPVLGANRWETFLTSELPPLIDAKFDGNGLKALEGVSMGAEAAMMLAMRHPGAYRAVAAHSGCYAMGSDVGQAQARAIISTYNGNPDNMFGEQNNPAWLAHDVMAHADQLRGTALFLSAGNGLPGSFDGPSNPDSRTSVVFGGPLEAGAYACTMALADRLERMQIPAKVDLRSVGTHSWPYWAAELPQAWPTLAGALGVS